MSLVGPRPERPYFVNKFKQIIPRYAHRLYIKPGLTGLAQIYHKYDSSIDDVRKKLIFDLQYLHNNTLTQYCKITFMTVYIIVSGKGRF